MHNYCYASTHVINQMKIRKTKINEKVYCNNFHQAQSHILFYSKFLKSIIHKEKNYDIYSVRVLLFIESKTPSLVQQNRKTQTSTSITSHIDKREKIGSTSILNIDVRS